MKSFWLTAKIAIVFAVLIAVVHSGVLVLFMRVAGHDMLDELSRLRAIEGVMLARELERRLERGVALDDPSLEELLDQAGRHHGYLLETRDQPPKASKRVEHRPWHPDFHSGEIIILGRRCFAVTLPSPKLWIPIHPAGDVESTPVAYLQMAGRNYVRRVHGPFLRGMFWLGALSLLGVLGLSAYLTRPIRAMSRSMDRVAEGDLDHRATVRGRDEVAAMGRSFNRMAERVQAMLRGQKELLAAVSHELRSPLARMKMGIELMRSSADERRLDELDGEIDHLDALVGRLLTAGRLELTAEDLQPSPQDLESVVKEAWARTGETQPTDQNLELDITPGAARVGADPALIHSLFDNLFSNARRYARSGPVTVKSRRQGDRVVLRVIDRGPGVDPEHLEHLFEPFFRADKARSPDRGHVGLGLMVVQKAVAVHGGTVRAEASSPSGLSIRFDLPAA